MHSYKLKVNEISDCNFEKSVCEVDDTYRIGGTLPSMIVQLFLRWLSADNLWPLVLSGLSLFPNYLHPYSPMSSELTWYSRAWHLGAENSSDLETYSIRQYPSYTLNDLKQLRFVLFMLFVLCLGCVCFQRSHSKSLKLQNKALAVLSQEA